MNKPVVNRQKLSQRQGDMLFSVALVLPVVLITAIFILVPVIDSVIKSFQDITIKNILKDTPGVWNNFENYTDLFKSRKFLPTVGVTFQFMFIVVIFEFILGMALAVTINATKYGSRIIRSLMMIPWVVPTVISALVWLWMYQPQYGLLKYIASLFGNNDFAILNNTSTSLYGVMIAALWKNIPMTTLLLLAGLQNVPGDILEAATVDGAGKYRKFFSIIIPSMKSVISITVSMAIIDNFKQFPLIWNMTGGGPNHSTTTLAVMSYIKAFTGRHDLGAGAAVTTVWMVVMLIVVLIYNKVMGKNEIA